MARSGATWNTAASSRLEASTRIRGSVATGTWRKTCANSAGPSLQAQPAPCEQRVSRMAAMETGDLRSTEDTLSQSPGENGAGAHVPRRVHEADDELLVRFPPAQRVGREQADQKEQQPPAAASQRVEPQRPEERDHHRFEQTSRNGAAAVRPYEIAPPAGRSAVTGRLLEAVV